MTEPIYREDQKIDRRIRIVLLILTLCTGGLLLLTDLMGIDKNKYLFLLGLLLAFLYIASLTFKFKTLVYKDHVAVCFWPFFNDSFKRSEIAGIQTSGFNIAGFGVRYDVATATTYYKAAGKKGIQLILKNQQKIVIGSQRAAKLKACLDNFQTTI